MKKIKIVIPKGRIFNGVVELLKEAGIRLEVNDRLYVPPNHDPEVEIKIMKPQNIAQLVELGCHDVGFTGYDWIKETGVRVVEIMDLGLDQVRIVAAIPENVDEKSLYNRQIVVASEYENLTKDFLARKGFNFVFIRTYGATEAFPPQDADMIVDNCATGRTLAEHQLKIMAELMDSSTRFIANEKSLADPWKREKIDELKMLCLAIINARSRVMLEMNIPADKLAEAVAILPCMRAPTVSPLYQNMGYAVKVAVKKEETAKIIPRLKKIGATDILEYDFKKVVS